jgi:hypothetical protein
VSTDDKKAVVKVIKAAMETGDPLTLRFAREEVRNGFR